jgi:hypothetical protein
LDDLLAWLYLIVKTHKSMKWNGRKDLVLGRTLEPFPVLINMYKNRYVIVLILVSMFGGCRGG